VFERPPQIPEDYLELVIEVTPQYAGWRADRFVAHRIPRLSRNRIQQIFKVRAFDGNGRPMKADQRMRTGECIVMYRSPPDEPVPDAELVVLYEDEWFIAVDKPPGLAEHPTAKHHHHTVTWLLEERFGRENRPNLAHRIDAETSGVLLCTRDLDAEREMKKMFARRDVRKQYVAIVRGILDPPSGRIEVPIAPNPHSIVKARMWCGDPQGMPALTEYETIRVIGDCTFVRLKPRTGRQHQLRVHLDHIGHTIVGDKLYGPDESLFLDYIHGGLTEDIIRRAGHRRQALHAARLEFRHPVTRQQVVIESPLPADMQALLAAGFSPAPDERVQ